jgi:hypothetical protein
MLDKAAVPPVRVLAARLAANASAGALPKEAELDDLQDPEATFYVLDADARQRLCLEAAARGHSFLMLGPKGSGKSQTIANMAADALARGKTILVVSDNATALTAIAGFLQQAGLGACFGSNEAGMSAPAKSVDFARLKQLRQRLAAHVHALHSARNPLGRTVWSAIAELTGLRTLPAYPLGLALSRAGLETAENLVVVTEVTPAWLEEATQAIRRLQQVWPLRDQQDFPWRGFRAERYNKQLRDDVAALIDRVRARLDRLLALGEQYGEQVGCKGPIRSLLNVGELLESAPPGLAPHWLKAEPGELAAELDRCADEYQRLGQARAPLTARYGPRIWDLPEGTAAAVERAWKAAAPLLPAGDEGGVGLLAQQQVLRGWAADTQRRIPGWLTEARVLEKWLAIALPRGSGAEPDQTKADPAPLHLRNLQRLANLCMSEYPPERTWVHEPKALADARALIASARPVLAGYHERRRKLLEVYKESLFELDVPRIAGAFAGPYRPWWRVLKGQFRQDRRAIRRRTHSLVVPPTMAEDMRLAHDLLGERRRLESESAARQAVLGRYEKGLDTNFDAAERAVRIAAEAVELVYQLGYSALPARFVDVLCGGGAPPEKIRAAAKRLHDSLGAWPHATHELKKHLPLDAMPGTGQPLEESALSAVNVFARDLQAALNQFAAVADPVLTQAPARPPDAVTLAADLREAEEVRSWEATQSTEGPRWQERLGPGFQGIATDWDPLRKALAWTRRVHDVFQGAPPERFCELACADADTGLPAKRPSSHEPRNALEQYEQVLHSLEHRFDSSGPVFEGKRLGEHPPEIVKQRLTTMRQRLGELADWVDLQQLPIRLGHLGLGIFWEELKTNPPAAEQIADIFSKAFWSCWLEAFVQQDPALAQFNRSEHQRTQEEFRQLDRDWLRDNGRRILDRVARSVNAAKPVALLSCAEAALLPSDVKFDRLIFDDAESTPVDDALEAVEHCPQLIICGNDESPPDGSEDPRRSILGAAVDAGLPAQRLSVRYEQAAAAAMDTPATDGEPGALAAEIIETLRLQGYSAQFGLKCGDLHIDVAVADPASPDRYLLAIQLDGPSYASRATVRDRDRLHTEVLQRRGWTIQRIWGLDWLSRRDEEIERLCRAVEAARRPV